MLLISEPIRPHYAAKPPSYTNKHVYNQRGRLPSGLLLFNVRLTPCFGSHQRALMGQEPFLPAGALNYRASPNFPSLVPLF